MSRRPTNVYLEDGPGSHALGGCRGPGGLRNTCGVVGFLRTAGPQPASPSSMPGFTQGLEPCALRNYQAHVPVAPDPGPSGPEQQPEVEHVYYAGTEPPAT